MAQRKVRGKLKKLTLQQRLKQTAKAKSKHHAGRVWARQHVIGRNK